MIKISITPEDIAEAKKVINNFDSEKIYNKYECSNNFLGPLGEMAFERWLCENNIEHSYYGFRDYKLRTSDPDFIIFGKTIDLKTTIGTELHIQNPKFDIYIYSTISAKLDEVKIIGYITKEKIIELKNKNLLKTIFKNNNEFNVMKVIHLTPIERLFKIKEDDLDYDIR